MITVPILLAASIVITLAGLGAVALWIVGSAILTGGRREDPADVDARSASRFTIPVSVLVPLSGDSATASATLTALAALRYPELEIIAISDDTTHVEDLAGAWGLEPKEFFFRRSIETAPVKRIYHSSSEPRLLVILQAPGTAVDALNCGMNMARYRYVLCLPPGIEFDADALLRLMAGPLHDPATVIGASAHLEPRDSKGRLKALRSLMASRLVWCHAHGFPPPGAVNVWRRDAVLEAGGFSRSAPDLDLDLARRLLLARRAESGARRFHRGADIFGCAATTTSGSGISTSRLRAAAHLVGSACAWPRTPTIGVRAIALFAGAELLLPAAQAWVVSALTLGAGLGWFSWSAAVTGVVVLACGRAAVSAAALLLRGGLPDAPAEPALRRALLAAPFELPGRLARSGYR